jgi:hypothetical protein
MANVHSRILANMCRYRTRPDHDLSGLPAGGLSFRAKRHCPLSHSTHRLDRRNRHCRTCVHRVPTLVQTRLLESGCALEPVSERRAGANLRISVARRSLRHCVARPMKISEPCD